MHPELKAHPEYFKREIIQLADNVYMAFGFAASNQFMIVGDDGPIIIDTSETTKQPKMCWRRSEKYHRCQYIPLSSLIRIGIMFLVRLYLQKVTRQIFWQVSVILRIAVCSIVSSSAC